MSQISASTDLRQAGERTSFERIPRERSFAGMAWRRFRQDKVAVMSLLVLALMVGLALGAGLVAEHVTDHTPYDQDLRSRFEPIGGNGYLLGSDDLGRDTATRLLYGARVSLGVAGLSIVVALLFGAG